jgi:hypothetical protein
MAIAFDQFCGGSHAHVEGRNILDPFLSTSEDSQRFTEPSRLLYAPQSDDRSEPERHRRQSFARWQQFHAKLETYRRRLTTMRVPRK